jgi:hypothetical protein
LHRNRVLSVSHTSPRVDRDVQRQFLVVDLTGSPTASASEVMDRFAFLAVPGVLARAVHAALNARSGFGQSAALTASAMRSSIEAAIRSSRAS